MLMPIKRNIYAVGCPSGLFPMMKETAETVCGIQDAKWHACDAPSEEMRGFCIILFGSAHVAAVAKWAQDTEIILIADSPDMSYLRQGFVDVLAPPPDKERFAAAFSNMICRCTLRQQLCLRENQIETYFEISDDLLWSKDLSDLHIDVNHALADLIGKPREQIAGKHENEAYGLAPGEEGCKQSDLYVRSAGTKNSFEESLPGADGHQHHLHVTKAPWLDGQGRIVGTIGLGRDITAFKNQQTMFDRFLNDLELGVVIVDNEESVLQANRVFLDVLGLDGAEAVGQNIDELVRIKYERSKAWGPEDYIVFAEDGSKTVWTHSEFELSDYWDNQYGYIHIFQDVTQERALEDTIMNMAVHDQLTGLPNRAGMYKYFDALDKSRVATFLFIDIDNFKLVNDEFGHDLGDRMLKDVAGLFGNILRDCFTARMGGDEFLSILDGSMELSEVKDKTAELLLGIKRLTDYPERVLEIVSFSIGILFRCPLEEDLNSIIRKSDEGMYQAKWTGKNKFCIYSPDEYQKLQNKLMNKRQKRRQTR